MRINSIVPSRPAHHRRRDQGHIIVLTLVASLVLGVVLVSVISLSSSEGQMTGRSESWNAAMPVVEAGIEEALTQLRYAPSNRSANGWTLIDDQYTKKRTLGDGFYEVSISTDKHPTITSRGLVKAPNQTNYSIYRVVRVAVTNEPLFSNAMEALSTIDMSGNNVRVDSYDSRDPKYSGPNGAYNPGHFKDNGDIVSYGGIINSLNLGNANIYGKVITGPDGSMEIGPNGVVGSLDWHTSGSGIQPGWSKQTALPDYPPVIAPTGGAPAVGGTVDKVKYQYVLGNGNYQVNGISGSVLVTGQAVLTVDQFFSISGQDSIRIEPGASLTLYVKATDVSIGGQGVVNGNTDAASFMYFGLPSNQSISIAGNGSLRGVIYAPDATLTMVGGGNDALDFMGATITRAVKMTGKWNFHYDEATRRLFNRGFVVTSWDEL
jgi:hypothetical protein